MGRLDLKCITLSGSRFVGMSYTFPTPENTPTNTNPYNRPRGPDSYSHVALIQSNQNPKGLHNLTWSLVSIWPRIAAYTSDMFSSLNCHSDPTTGIFTMMSNFSANNAEPEYVAGGWSPRQPGGFQYNPKNDRWSEFGVSPGYLWGNVSATFDLLNWPGTSTLYQANIGNASTGTINLGMLLDAGAAVGNTATGEPAKFVNVANYTLDPATHGYPIKLAYANSSIYQLGRLIVDRSAAEFSYFLTRIPLLSADGQSFKLPTTGLVAYDAAAVKDCQMETARIWYSAPSATLYFICQILPSLQRQSGLVIISQFKDGDKGLSSPSNLTLSAIQTIIQPIDQGQGSGSSSPPWIFLSSSGGLQSEITLDPSKAPKVFDTPTSFISIKDPYGYEVPTSIPEYFPPVNHTPAITAGIAIGVIVILVAVLYRPVRRWLPGWREKWAFFKVQTWPRWRRRVRLKLIEILKEDNDTDNSKNQDEEALAGKTVISKEGGADEGEFNNKIEEHRMTSLDLEGCDKILVTDDMDLSGLDSMWRQIT
ncbi:hypothetical protein BGW39_005217 [Mortierella sp. 14UC]|nr:hypothetical protein BGW39_005217 [Mortierella sp. 14UC]